MRRGIQVVVSLLAVVMLVRPFDCFANGPRTREAMDCCLKGKCVPSVKADDCCKNTVPSANNFLGSKVAGQSGPMFAITPGSISILVPPSPVQDVIDLLRHPPPPG